MSENLRNVYRKSFIKCDYAESTERKRPRLSYHIWPMPERPNKVGTLYVCGQGDVGQLGLGLSKLQCKKLTINPKIEGIVDVIAGGMHSLLLTAAGKVYSFGCNDDFALGRDTNDETPESEFEPTLVQLPATVLKVTAGDSHSACLLNDGRIFAWGNFRNSNGNMGLTMSGHQRDPIDILPGRKCCDLASGVHHLMMLTIDGALFTIGCGEQGQLGRLIVNVVNEQRANQLMAKQVFFGINIIIKAIWATEYSSFALDSNSSLWVFGLNNFHQLGICRLCNILQYPIRCPQRNVQQIAGGQHHTLLLDHNNLVVTVGRSNYGCQGRGPNTKDLRTFDVVTSLSNEIVNFIACGSFTSFAVTSDGELFSWGMGSNYQLGSADADDVWTPVIVACSKQVLRVASGGLHSLVLIADETQQNQIH